MSERNCNGRDHVNERILDRLIEACRAGLPCKTSDTGPRRLAALSCGGLGILYKQGLWPEAMRRIVAIGTAHSAARARFLNTWSRVPLLGLIRDMVGDDDLLFAGLRVLLPPYDGPIIERFHACYGPKIELFRGQRNSDPIGASWSRSLHIAENFARYGANNVNNRWPGYADGVVLRAVAEPKGIICAPWLFGYTECEYIVDQRNLGE